MRFGEIFGKSWEEYGKNFMVFLKIFILLSIIPAVIFFIIQIPSTLEILKLGANPAVEDVLSVTSQSSSFLLTSIPIAIVSVLFSLFMSTCFIYNAVYRKKQMSFKETLKGGGKYFGKYLLYFLVFYIFLIGLFLLFVIPGIIFLIFWIFSSYILIGENKGTLESLKSSRNMVRGKWWKVFGYALLFILIAIGIGICFGVVGGILSLVLMAIFGNSVNIQLVVGGISQLFNLGANLIVIPLGILFFKNFYLEMKDSKVEKKSKKVKKK